MKFSEKVKYARMKRRRHWLKNLVYPTLQFAAGKRITVNRKSFLKASFMPFAKVKESRLKTKAKNIAYK